MANIIYTFTREQKKAPPGDWALPVWHNTVIDWDKRFGHLRVDEKGRRLGPIIVESGGCKLVSGDCPLSPEEMCAHADQYMYDIGLWPRTPTLPLDVYTLARNIRSEFGGADTGGTPEERVAIAWAEINRAVADGNTNLTAHLTGRSKKYGSQGTSGRHASTAQDPSVVEILLAALVYDGWKQGWMEDITHGAFAYLDRVSQDAQSRTRAKIIADITALKEQGQEAPWSVTVRGKRQTFDVMPGVVKNGVEVYDSWTAGGNYPTWVGHVPNVRPWRLMLVKERRDLIAAKQFSEFKAITKYGREAILAKNTAPTPFDKPASPTEEVIAWDGKMPTGKRVGATAVASNLGEAAPVSDNVIGATVVGVSAALGIAAGIALGRRQR